MVDDLQGVSRPCPEYERMLPDWRLVAALLGGTRAMRSAGAEYLPRHPAERESDWRIRLNRAVLTNVFARTVKSLATQPLAKPLVLGPDVPARIQALAEDIDLCGRHLNLLAKEVFEAGLCFGLSHVLADFPPARRDKSGRLVRPTLAEEKSLGRRPYLVHVPALNLIGWRVEERSGRPILAQARIRETVQTQDGPWGRRAVEQIRVLEPGRYFLYRADGRGGFHLHEQGPVLDAAGQELEFIPLATFYAGRTGFLTARPPFLDLAHKNVEHWQAASDQRHALTVARFPILARSGVSPLEPESAPIIAPNVLLSTEDPQGRYYYVEHSGAAIAAGRQDLQDLLQEMSMLSLEPLLPRTGDPTATARAIDAAQAHSALQNLALSLGDALEEAFSFLARFLGLKDGGSIVVNTDFGLNLKAVDEIKALIDLRASGQIARTTLWSELKRRGLLADDFDAGSEERLLSGQAAR